MHFTVSSTAAGLTLLIPHVPGIMNDYFAQRRAGHTLRCDELPTDAPVLDTAACRVGLLLHRCVAAPVLLLQALLAAAYLQPAPTKCHVHRCWLWMPLAGRTCRRGAVEQLDLFLLKLTRVDCAGACGGRGGARSPPSCCFISSQSRSCSQTLVSVDWWHDARVMM